MFELFDTEKLGRGLPAKLDVHAQFGWVAVNLPGMQETDFSGDSLQQLSELRDRLHSELAALDQLILALQTAAAASRRELAKFELGQRLGATKLARLLGCSRNHAIKLIETDFANSVRTNANGYRWVPRSAAEEWLAGQGRGAA